MDQGNIGGQILLLLVQPDDSRIRLQTDNPGHCCRQRSGQGPQADTDFDHLILGGQSGQFDNPPGCMFVHQKVLAEFFVRGQSPAFEHLLGFFVGHWAV